jgi:hypothetical protein
MAAAKKSGSGKPAAKSGGTQTISGGKGAKPVTFQKGGLHKSLGVPEGQTIPASKMAAAAAGDYGPKAKAQAALAQGLLAKGRQTAAGNRRRSSSSKSGSK